MKALEVLSKELETLSLATIHYEQKALNFLLDSLLAKDEKYAHSVLYFSGQVEADASLISPFARVGCNYFRAVNSPWQTRLSQENRADSLFFHQNVKNISYLNVRQPVKRKMPSLIKPRNAQRIVVSSHVALGDRRYTRIDFPKGNFKGDAILIITDETGTIVNYCSLNYDLGQYVLNYQQ